MEKLLKYFIAPLFAIVVITMAVFFFFRSLINTSVPQYEGEVELAGLAGNVEIRTGEAGIPYIIAGNRRDLIFALGYLHARDRLLELEFKRMIAEGRLAAHFGQEAVEFDKYFRQTGMKKRAMIEAGELSVETAVLLKAYIDGLNGYLESENAVLQSEFAALGITPQRWRPADILMLTLFNNFVEESKYFTQDIISMLKRKMGPEGSAVIFGSESDSLAFSKLPQFNEDDIRKEMTLRKVLGANRSTGLNIAEVDGLGGIVLNMQGSFTFPGRFYQITFEAEGRKGSVATIPGLPVLFAGLLGDEFIAVKPAVKDLRTQHTLTLDEKGMIIDGKKGAGSLKTVKDTIPVKDEDPVILELKTGSDGRVYTAFSAPETRYNRDSSEVIKVITATSVRTGSFSASSFLNTGIELWKGGFAGRYFEYEGNSDIWFSKGPGKLTKNSPRFVQKDADDDQPKKSRKEKKPQPKRKPKTEEIENTGTASDDAENAPAIKITEAATGLYDGFFRGPAAERERTYLLSPEGKDIPSFVVNDVISDLNLKLVPFILNAFDQLPGQKDTLISQSLKIISRWSGEYLSSLQAPLVMAVFLKYLTVNTFGDEFTRDDLLLLLEAGGIPGARISTIVEENYSPVFDIKSTPDPENRDEIIRKSFSEAVREIASIHGDDPVMWLWGEENTITPGHILGGFLGGINNAISIEKAGISGSFDTRFSAFNNPFSDGEGKGRLNSWGTLLRLYINPGEGVFRMVPYLGNSGNFADPNSVLNYEVFLEGRLLTVSPVPGNNDKVLKLIKKL